MRLGESIYYKRPSKLKRGSSTFLFVIAMATLGFLTQFQWLGHIVIAVYAVWALVRHIPARSTFVLSLFTLGIAPLGILLSNWVVAQNFAAYSFVLFAFGAVQLILEERKEFYVKSRNDNNTP